MAVRSKFKRKTTPRAASETQSDRVLWSQLADSADRLEDVFQVGALAIFAQLRRSDPELVKSILQVWSDRKSAARWMVKPVAALGGISPLRAIARGQRDSVIQVLGRIEHGVFS
jgi:uncharacterized protein (DUF2384 family)